MALLPDRDTRIVTRLGYTPRLIWIMHGIAGKIFSLQRLPTIPFLVIDQKLHGQNFSLNSQSTANFLKIT